MARAMRTYFMKYRFTHPVKEDFLKTIEEVSGKDLRWYFNQAVYGSQIMDYSVMGLDSFPVDWYAEKKEKARDRDRDRDRDKDRDKDKDKKDKKDAKHDTVYQSYVSLLRKEDFLMPVVVEITFDNGEKVREHWDGQGRWIRFSYQKKAKIVSAELDPDHTVQIDRNEFNNSYTVESNGKPAHKVANYWLFLTQLLSQALSWWAV